MTLSDLIFSDLFVGQDAANSWYKPTPDSLETHSIPECCNAEISNLRKQLEQHSGSSHFRITWSSKEELKLRVLKETVADSLVIFVCRRFNLPPGPLHTLGMPAAVANKLLAPELRDGLVVFMGRTGSGKTTTACSFIHERLTNFGGVCWTIEHPIELPMQGRHGLGVCYQTEINSDDEIGAAIENLYRASPNIIFIGEIKNGKAMREAIAAGTGGHIVVVTLHSNNLINGLSRLARMADDADGSIGLADALKLAIHLKLDTVIPGRPLPGKTLTMDEPKGTGTPARVLSVEPLWMSGEIAEGLKSTVRGGDFHMLKSEIERQRRTFMNQKIS